MVSRKSPLTMSAAPAMASASSATHNTGANPKPMMAAPHTAAAMAMARPWRCTCLIQPLVDEVSSAPADGAA